LIKGLFPY